MGRYEARRKVLIDEAAGIAHAHEQGKLAERMQLVRSMHKNGMHIEDIAKFTGLRIDEIRGILEQ